MCAYYDPSAVDIITKCPGAKKEFIVPEAQNDNRNNIESEVDWNDEKSIDAWKHYQAKKALYKLADSFQYDKRSYDDYGEWPGKRGGDVRNLVGEADSYYDKDFVDAIDNNIAKYDLTNLLKVGPYVRYVFEEIHHIFTDYYDDDEYYGCRYNTDFGHYIDFYLEEPVDIKFANFSNCTVDTAIIFHTNNGDYVTVIDYRTDNRNLDAKNDLKLVLSALGLCMDSKNSQYRQPHYESIKLVIFSDKAYEYETSYEGLRQLYQEKILPAMQDNSMHVGDWCFSCPMCEACVYRMMKSCQKMEALLQEQLYAGNSKVTDLDDMALTNICVTRDEAHTATDAIRKTAIERIRKKGSCAGYVETTSRSIKPGCDNFVINRLQESHMLIGSPNKIYTPRRLSMAAIDKVTGSHEKTRNILGPLIIDRPAGKIKKMK